MENRQIKFRIWNKRMTRFETARAYAIRLDFITNQILDGGHTRKYTLVENQDNYIIQQFTGLFDFEGKEIHEGDIVYFKDFCNYLIRWDEDLKGFNFRQVEFQELYSIDVRDGWPPSKDMEIIGNIFETPELLK